MKKTKLLQYRQLIFCLLTLNMLSAHAIEISPLIGVGQENLSFEILDFTNTDRVVRFEPNMPGLVSLGISALGFGIGYSIRGPRDDIDSQRTATEFSDWQLSYNSKNWGIETYYQNYKGFDTTNTNVVQQFPELRFNHIGFLARGSIGEQEQEFSLAALMNQSANITTTSWKVFWVAGYNQFEMHTDTSLLQQENAGIDFAFENLRDLKSSTIKAGFGAGKYWVSESRLFIGGLVDMLISYSKYKFNSTTGADTASKAAYNPIESLNFRVATGYSGSPFRLGLSLASNSSMLKTPGNGYIRTSSNRFQIYLRYIADF